MKARVYLDFDGVLNADRPRFDDAVNLSWTVKLGGGLNKVFPLTYSPALLKSLDALRDEYDFEFIWLSTWNEDLEILKVMNKIGFLTGGRVLPAHNLDRNADTNRKWTKWKADALISDQKDDETPYVWVDDEAIRYHKRDVIAATADTPKLMIEPRSYWGLNPSNLSTIENFLKSLLK